MKHIFFDLDGTLLPMDQQTFASGYFAGLTKYFVKHGYDKDIFMNALKVSTYKMFENDGSCSNEDLFFNTFVPMVGKTKEELMPLLVDFYTNYFPTIIDETCGYNERSKEAIHILKEKGYNIYILTNPLFPALATHERVRHAGIDLNDIKFVTTYENSSFAKPNPMYFEEVMKKFNIAPNDVMMFGNDTREDMAILKLGVACYIIEDDLIDKDNVSLDSVEHGSFDDFMTYIKNMEVAA